MFATPPLSLALVDLPVDVPAGSDLFRAQVAFAKDAAFRAVQLNAATAGMRARDLDRSARRDVAAHLKRNEMVLSGADLWVPQEHFTDPARVDRAVAAVMGAIELVADLDRLVAGPDGRVVCLALPENVDRSVVGAITAKASERGTRVADFGAGLKEDTGVPGALGPGFDPAAFLLAGRSITGAGSVINLPPGLVAARLTDAGAVGRVAPGSSGGRLDLLAYAVALAASGYRGHVVLDGRGLADPLKAAPLGREAWERTASAGPAQA